MSTVTAHSLKPRIYNSTTESKYQNDARSRYAFNPFRTLDISEMRLCKSIIRRFELTLIETFPRHKPHYETLIDTGRLVMSEVMVPAILQVESLVDAYQSEGMVYFDISAEEAVELYNQLEGLEEMTLQEALSAIQKNSNIPQSQKDILVGSLTQCIAYAKSVLAETQREIQSTKSGKKGKSFLDSRDQLACRLLGTSESSIHSAEAESANSRVDRLADRIASSITGGSDNDLKEIVKAQATALEALKKKIESLEKVKK